MKEKTCLYLLGLLSTIALLCLSQCFAQGQSLTMPGYLSRDPEYWWHQTQMEQNRADAAVTRADELVKEGTKAITGLQAHLKQANDSIARQNQTIKRVTKSYDIERSRADQAEQKLEAFEAKQSKTWAGRQIQKIGETGKNVLAGIGAVTVTAITLKLVL